MDRGREGALNMLAARTSSKEMAWETDT